MDQVSHLLAQLAKRPLFCDTVEILFEKIRAVGCAGRGLRVDVAIWYPSNEATFVRAAPTAPVHWPLAEAAGKTVVHFKFCAKLIVIVIGHTSMLLPCTGKTCKF